MNRWRRPRSLLSQLFEGEQNPGSNYPPPGPMAQDLLGTSHWEDVECGRVLVRQS